MSFNSIWFEMTVRPRDCEMRFGHGGKRDFAGSMPAVGERDLMLPIGMELDGVKGINLILFS